VRVDIYTRLSRDREEQTSTKRQERDCRALALAKGWDVCEVHEDVDLSAYSGVRRPGYETMLARVTAGQVEAVIVWKIDRLARSLREFMRFEETCARHGVALTSVNEPFDTSSPIGRAIVQVLAVFAELEAATIGLRVKSARDHAAREGKPHSGGGRRFGYTRAMELDPVEAAAVSDAAERALRGESYTSIARRWNEAGIAPPGRAAEWSALSAGRTLRQPHLAGLRVHRGAVVGDGTWEPIITREAHEALVAQTRRRTRKPPRRSFLLSGGLLLCGKCGTPMIAHMDKKARTYRCPKRPGSPGCGGVSIRADQTEAWVRDLVLAALARPEFRPALQRQDDQSDASDALARLTHAQGKLEELGVSYAQDRLPLTAFVAASDELRLQIDAIQRELEAAGQRSVFTDLLDPAAVWEERDVTWRAALVDALFEPFVVQPAGRGSGINRADPSARLEIRPRP
jgi:DNA invertase Pin-like site-specific DNA recombinase